MATYEELFNLADNNTLLDRIAVAITIAAHTVLNEADTVPNHAARLVWARSAFRDPKLQAKSFLHVVLAANSNATVTQINAATDQSIQTNINAAVNVFAGV